MIPRELNKLLVLEFPELKETFKEETSWQEGMDTGSFIVFEDVFIPYLEMCIINDKASQIEKIYSFIEKLSKIDDEYVENIVTVAIIENIVDHVESEKYAKYLKPNSKKIYDSYITNLKEK